MIISIPELGFELRPYSKGTCWQLYEFVTDRRGRAGAPFPDAWQPVDFYPGTLEYGLSSIRERAARRSKVAGDLKAALAELATMNATIEAACDGLSLRQTGESAADIPTRRERHQ